MMTTNKTMTADELMRIATKLANAAHVRYWLHWNYPLDKPIMMAISIVNENNDGSFSRSHAIDLLDRGFVYESHFGIYRIERDMSMFNDKSYWMT